MSSCEQIEAIHRIRKGFIGYEKTGVDGSTSLRLHWGYVGSWPERGGFLVLSGYST